MGQHHRRSGRRNIRRCVGHYVRVAFQQGLRCGGRAFYVHRSVGNRSVLSCLGEDLCQSVFRLSVGCFFVCGLVMAVFDTAMAYESGAANIRQTCVNVIKGFMAAASFCGSPTAALRAVHSLTGFIFL